MRGIPICGLPSLVLAKHLSVVFRACRRRRRLSCSDWDWKAPCGHDARWTTARGGNVEGSNESGQVEEEGGFNSIDRQDILNDGMQGTFPR
ncbi:uncharacterized protein BDZ83DRAFT_624565 [Colletotrichum acutatum]|uniref:Uncharacterized protein n=1 Tax=Glomerella acutata TaxID=27357 RepID=A0AAD8ULT8_GLOAC|nr:uncharacterized protein BDZ83DRAFT_624565 [Colletotrichum acutatum]KAK1723908.1 hypothetical protein BDZ83DRAFT_624565 [Colletotrichum acutatum]